MSTGSNPDVEARSFAETRRTLLEALDRTEQEAHDRAAELVRVAERRAREITIQADQSAALIEEQLTYLTTQLEHVRGRVTAIRSRLAHDLQANLNPITNSAPGPELAARPAPAAEYVPTPAATVADALPRDAATDDDSLPETLRVLRAALESLNGQPASATGTHRP